MPTVTEFLKSLPPERRREMTRVRTAIRKHLPKGYQEVVEGKIIAYQVPLDRANHRGRALWFAALAAPKTYLTLHLMPVYASPALLARLKAGFRAAGKKLDIGKACIRYQRAEDLDLKSIGEVVASLPMEQWIAVATAAWKR